LRGGGNEKVPGLQILLLEMGMAAMTLTLTWLDVMVIALLIVLLK
jgi:hypothetical protein